MIEFPPGILELTGIIPRRRAVGIGGGNLLAGLAKRAEVARRVLEG